MLYYRTHASRSGEKPPELTDWRPPNETLSLQESTVGAHRVFTISEPFVFTPPEAGWVPLCPGWEVANVGKFNPLVHAKLASSFSVVPLDIDGQTILFPCVLNEAGSRTFKIRYGGSDFSPLLTDEQTSALQLAKEIRTCHESGKWPEMNVRAQWAARLLSLSYCLSPASIALVGLISDDLILAAEQVAGGFYGRSS